MFSLNFNWFNKKKNKDSGEFDITLNDLIKVSDEKIALEEYGVVKRDEWIYLGRMISIAANEHQDQFDKGGKPYILHPIRAMMRLRTEDPELMQIAIGHDLIENTDIIFGDLIDFEFSERVIKGIRDLTKFDDESYEQYIKKVCSNIDAIKVKIEDIRDNTDVTRLKGISEKDHKRTEKYHRTYLELVQKLKEFNNG